MHFAAWVVVVTVGPEVLLDALEVGRHIEKARPRRAELCAEEDDGTARVLRREGYCGLGALCCALIEPHLRVLTRLHLQAFQVRIGILLQLGLGVRLTFSSERIDTIILIHLVRVVRVQVRLARLVGWLGW